MVRASAFGNYAKCLQLPERLINGAPAMDTAQESLESGKDGHSAHALHFLSRRVFILDSLLFNAFALP
jgi:hypothetical protein